MRFDTAIRVLIVDDSETDAKTIVSELESGGLTVDAERIDREDDFTFALKSSWDVVICDFIVPGMNWKQSLAKVRERYPNMPFIIVSGKHGEEYAVETMRAGCSDYLVKDRLIRLAPAVVREVEASIDRVFNEEKRRILELELQRSRGVEVAGRLAAGLAHNLNNVLMVIMSGLDLVLHKQENNEDRLYLEDAARAAESAAKMVRQLEDLASEPEFRPATNSIETLIDRVDILVRPTLGEFVSFTTKCDSNIRMAIVDGGLIEQALLNLLLNARDAVAGHGCISLEAQLIDENIVIGISDDGAGVPEELRLNIFEPLFSTKGTGYAGLGLSTVYQAVSAHDGIVSVTPGETGGSLFKISLPFIAAPAGEYSVEQAWTLGSGRILLLDDAEDSLLAARGILERCGYEVSTAKSLEEARRILQRGMPVDVILAEAMMQEGGARELLQWLDECRRSIPVVALSAYQSERWERYRLYEGFAAFLPKPFNGTELSKTVARVCHSTSNKPSTSTLSETQNL